MGETLDRDLLCNVVTEGFVEVDVRREHARRDVHRRVPDRVDAEDRGHRCAMA